MRRGLIGLLVLASAIIVPSPGGAAVPLRDLSYTPDLPLGTQSALRDLSCNAVVPLGL